MHNLQVYADSVTSNNQNVFIHDLSVYDSLIPVTTPTLQCKTPLTDGYKIIPFTKGGISPINSTVLGLTIGTNFLNLPDGFYSVVYSVSPHTEVKTCINFYITNRLKCQWLSLVATEFNINEHDVDALGNIVKDKNANMLLFVNALIENCKYLASINNETLAVKYYNKANRLLGLLNVK